MIIENYIRVDKAIFNNLPDSFKNEWENFKKEENVIEVESSYLISPSLYKEITLAIVDKRDPYGIPNVNFSLISEDDNRWEKYKQQRLSRGFDNSELWSLDNTIAKFIAPRIREFAKNPGGIPGKVDFMTKDQNLTDEEKKKFWKEVLEKIAWTFENYTLDPPVENYNEWSDKIDEGLVLFVEYFGCLWN